MIDAGHRDIACITGNVELNKYMKERMAAFNGAFKISDLKHNPEYILNIDNFKDDFSSKLSVFFNKNKKLTAVFMSGEVYQETTLRYFVNNNIRIPNDISVAAVDEISPVDGLSQITCLRQPMEEMAWRAIDILNEIYSGKNSNVNRGEVLQPIICDNGTVKDIK